MKSLTKRKRGHLNEKHKKMRVSLVEQDPRCCWCDKELTQETATLEHVDRFAETGDSGLISIACKPCNGAWAKATKKGMHLVGTMRLGYDKWFRRALKDVGDNEESVLGYARLQNKPIGRIKIRLWLKQNKCYGK